MSVDPDLALYVLVGLAGAASIYRFWLFRP